MRHPPPPAPAGDHLVTAVDSIRRIVHALRASARRAGELPGGLTVAQMFVLQTLALGPVRSLNELAGRTFTHQSTVSVVVGRLVRRGLVVRRRGADDARRLEFRISPKGRAMARRAPPMAQHRLIHGLQTLPRRDVRALAGLLRRVVVGMGLAHTGPGMFFEGAGSRS